MNVVLCFLVVVNHCVFVKTINTNNSVRAENNNNSRGITLSSNAPNFTNYGHQGKTVDEFTSTDADEIEENSSLISPSDDTYTNSVSRGTSVTNTLRPEDDESSASTDKIEGDSSSIPSSNIISAASNDVVSFTSYEPQTGVNDISQPEDDNIPTNSDKIEERLSSVSSSENDENSASADKIKRDSSSTSHSNIASTASSDMISFTNYEHRTGVDDILQGEDDNIPINTDKIEEDIFSISSSDITYPNTVSNDMVTSLKNNEYRTSDSDVLPTENDHTSIGTDKIGENSSLTSISNLNLVPSSPAIDETEETAAFISTEVNTLYSHESTTDNSCFENIEIENLLITNIHNSYATLQWDSPHNVQCVKTYIVYINNIEYRNTSNTSILVTNLAACVQYEVAVAVFDGNSTRNVIQNNFTTTVPKHLEVTNLSVVKRENFGVILRWDPPKNVQCVDTYVVYLNGKNRSNTSNANISITGLQACKQYKAGIAVFDGHKIGKTIQTTFKTTVPKPFNYSVQNIKTVATGKMLNITWETPPKSVLQCVTGYYLWWQDDEDDKTRQRVKTNQTYVELPLIGCMHYQIEIYPIVSDGLDAPSQSKSYIGEFPTKAPQIIPQIQDKTYANVKWITESENKCKLIQIVAICDAPDDINDDYPWINKHQKTVLNVTTFRSNQFIMSINNLSSFTNYTCEGFTVNTAGKSDVQIFNISTNEDVPSAPEPIDIVEVGTHNFRIKWTKPSVIPGIMSSYGLLIRNDGPNFAHNERCPNLSHISDHYFSANVSQNSFDFNNAMPYYNYTISVYGIDRAGNGSNATVQVTTKAIKPDNVTNPQLLPPLYSEEEKYFAMATLKFDPPCKMNGPFRFYQIHLNGQRDGFASDETDISTGETTNNLTLLPERVYSIKISVVTEGFSSSVSLPSFKSRPGVPSLGPLQPPTSNDSTKAYFKLSRNAFDDTNGEILDYVLILFSKFPSADKTYGFWSDSDNKTWPSILYNSEGKVAPYHIIKILRNPFKNGVNNIDFVIGEDGTCSDDIVCNKPLKQDTEYFLIVRALTSATFKDSPPLYFKTGTQNNVGLGLGLTFGFFIVLTPIIYLTFLWRRKKRTNEEGNSSPTSLPASIACKKFSDYYETIKENQTILKSQYTALASQSKELALPTSYATLPENGRKNRYTNILPYDETRVKLKIDEDDEISSDYINASYIKGYSGKVEYIATQGPLASTSKDFWKMIVQENVTIIVMVSQFVEQSKEKCFQYFPNNHEKVSFGESLEVKCSTELHFGTYCIRTLQVRKDTEQRNVIHMQFLEWPDFGVPQNTDNIMELRNQMREKASSEGGLIVVHCSAGVGRTGTLIALDILFQTIDHQKDINIYKTVFDLRKQRTHMVQTEKQYVFIHTCIKDYLETPIVQSNEHGQDYIYENMDVIKSSLKANLITTEVESAL